MVKALFIPPIRACEWYTGGSPLKTLIYVPGPLAAHKDAGPVTNLNGHTWYYVSPAAAKCMAGPSFPG